MKISCLGENNVNELFQLLQKYSFNSTSIELVPNFAKESQRKAFKEDLIKQGIKPDQMDLDEGDDDSDSDQDLQLNTSIVISHKSRTQLDVTREINDKYLVYYYMKSSEDQKRLISYCKRHHISIETNENIKFTGSQKTVDKLVENITSRKYGKSKDMKFEEAMFLRKTGYVSKFVSERVKLRIVPHDKGDDLCNLVVYANDSDMIQTRLDDINNVSNNVIKVLELCTKYTEADEMDKIE